MKTLERRPFPTRKRIDNMWQLVDPVWKEASNVIVNPQAPQRPFRSLSELGLKADFYKDAEDLLVFTDSVQMPDFTLRTTAAKTPNSVLPTDEFRAWFDLPSVDSTGEPFDQDKERKTDKLPIVVIDDEQNPANAQYIAESLIDLPPQWATAIEEVIESEGKQNEDEKKQPLRARIKTTFKAVLEELDYRLEPTLMPGVEVSEILEQPEPLTDKEASILFNEPNRKFASLFLTVCLMMQHEAPQVTKVEERTNPLNPPTPWIVPEGTESPQMLGSAMAPTIAEQPVGTTKTIEKATLPEPQSHKEKMQQLIAVELKKAEILTPKVLAYTWATVQHETASSWRAVREGYFEDERLGLAPGTTGRSEARKRGYEGGEAYFGKGLVQVTHLSGHKWVGDIIGVDLVNNPDLLLETDISVKALITWVKFREDGWGNTIVDYANEGDFVRARRPVNGSDRAVHIAGIAESFMDEAREMCTILG